MQLRTKYSIVAATLIFAAQASEEFISVQYLQYNEADNRTSVSAPSVMIQKDFGTDYTLRANLVSDVISGASQTYHDTSSAASGISVSGASAFSRGTFIKSPNIQYGNIQYSDARIAGGAALTKRLKHRDELTFGLNYSGEDDFYSKEASVDYMHWLSADKNQAISLGASYQSNRLLVECSFNKACSATNYNTIAGRSGASEEMSYDVVSTELSFRQNLNKNSYIKAAVFAMSESGYLSNPYLNIVENYNGSRGSIVAERRPESKVALGTSIKYAYALTDKLVQKINYRFYNDDWEIKSHTIEAKLSYESTPKWLLKFGIRHYSQTKAYFYSGSLSSFHTTDPYASSDYRLATYDSDNISTGFDYEISEDYVYNLDIAYYKQSASTGGNSLTASYIVTGLKYKF